MGQSLRILLAEDEPLIVNDIDELLAEFRFGRAAVIAFELEHALDAEAGGFDLAVLDVDLKGKAVWPVAEKLRAKGVPFLLLTGSSLNDLPELASVPVVQKPFAIAALIAALRQARELASNGLDGKRS